MSSPSECGGRSISGPLVSIGKKYSNLVDNVRLVKPTRRRVLALTSVGVGASVAGCASVTGFLSNSPPCDERILDTPPELYSSPVSGFELEIDPPDPQLGDEFEVRLRNTSESQKVTGQKVAFDVQYRDGDGWHSVYHVNSLSARADYGLVLPAGEAHTWLFNASSLVHPRDGIATCLDPSPGEYRFVYWSITVDEDSQDWSDAAITAPFSIVENS